MEERFEVPPSGYCDDDYEKEREPHRQERRKACPEGDHHTGSIRGDAMLAVRHRAGRRGDADAAGHLLQLQRGPRCCRNCKHFDPGARLQCLKPIEKAYKDKTIRMDCSVFEPRQVLDSTGRRFAATAQRVNRSPPMSPATRATRSTSCSSSPSPAGIEPTPTIPATRRSGVLPPRLVRTTARLPAIGPRTVGQQGRRPGRPANSRWCPSMTSRSPAENADEVAHRAAGTTRPPGNLRTRARGAPAEPPRRAATRPAGAPRTRIMTEQRP